MAHQPHFTFHRINLDCFVLNDGDRTVALITPQGNVDWLLPSPQQGGELLTSILKETHLATVRGLKFTLHLPEPAAVSRPPFRFAVSDHGVWAAIEADSASPDGRFAGFHRAVITLGATGRYEWALETRLRQVSAQPVALEPVPRAPPERCADQHELKLAWIEYNNVLPANTGLCFLQAGRKRFSRTLLTDRAGVVWHFPHQHQLHYWAAGKMQSLRFAAGAQAGFFLEDLNPVVMVEECSLEPYWGICDMYYDLHCGSHVPTRIEPGAEYLWRYRILYLDRTAGAELAGRARRVPVTAADYRRFQYPRLTLGCNEFRSSARVDESDEASAFRPAPPEKVWEPEGGPKGQGALRITQQAVRETVWAAAPPSHAPAGHRLRLRALGRTDRVSGKGFFLRVRVEDFQWRPQPGYRLVRVAESPPLTGTTVRWKEIEVPEIIFAEPDEAHLVTVELVLDGSGSGGLTNLDIGLERYRP